MAYCHIAHDCVIGDNIIMSNATQVAGEVRIDDFAVIGGGTLVHQFCHVGAHVMIQGGSLINKDIPPYVKAARNPISYAALTLSVCADVISPMKPYVIFKKYTDTSIYPA